MSKKFVILFGLIIAVFAISLASCSVPGADTQAVDMIEPGDKIGETVIRKIADRSEIYPVLWNFCDGGLDELSKEKTDDCVVAVHPTIFLGSGMMEADPDMLDTYWEGMTWEVSIDGKPVNLDSFGTIDALGGRFWNILLENPTPDPVQIVTIITADEDPPEQYGGTLNLSLVDPEVAESEQEADATLPPLSSGAAAGQHAYYSDKSALDFLLYLPAEYDESRQEEWPLIVYLHGSIPRADIDMLRENSLPKILEDKSDFPFVVISPRVLGEYEFWAEDEKIDALDKLLAEIQENLSLDQRRIYLTGESAGGNGSWEIGSRYPGRFAALVPVMGYHSYPFSVPDNICDLKDVPVWAFHGAKDELIPLDAEQQIVDALEECGGDVQFTIYPDGGHDIEEIVYDDPELFTWLLSQKLK